MIRPRSDTRCLRIPALVVGLFVVGPSVVAVAPAIGADDPVAVRAFLAKHCTVCHGAGKQEGDVRLDRLTGEASAQQAEAELWSRVLAQLETGAMPPEGRSRPAAAELLAATRGIRAGVGRAGSVLARRMQRPENGNYVPHDVLFDPATAARAPQIAASPARTWRILPHEYSDRTRRWLQYTSPLKVAGEDQGLPAPFALQPEHELKNYSFLYSLESSQTEGLANNARALLIRQLDGDPKNERSLMRKLALAKDPPSPQDVEKVVTDEYRYWIGRDPEPAELERKRESVLRKIRTFGNRDGLIYGLVPILIHPEAFFRAEFGGVAESPGEPSLLAPLELADALDRALRDRRGQEGSNRFVRLAQSGKLASRADVRAALEEKNAPKLSRAETVQRFLEEYFVYPQSLHVFKCPDDLKKRRSDPLFQGFDPTKTFGRDSAVEATRRFLDEIVADDVRVLERLLTIPTDYVAKSEAMQAKDRADNARWRQEADDLEKQGGDAKKIEQLRHKAKEHARNIATTGPARYGVLTQRSWLVSHSTNTENHAIHRGKWIRERLLGGRIPDVPITVDAALPEDPTKTLRERMEKTRGAQCWKCHRLMDPLGLPFEQWDHFGSFRETELDRPVVVSGEILDSGDPRLDGPVSGPDELVRKLAQSERVQQVFVRFAFRFWMGRNETLDDARTIQEAYRAYRESDGSFSALLKSLLTSDAFLYRTGAVPLEGSASSSGAASASTGTGVDRSAGKK